MRQGWPDDHPPPPHPNERPPERQPMFETSVLFGFIGTLGTGEIIILLIVGVLLFGRKLPEVGRYLGKGIVEFKKGIKGLEDEIDTSTTAAVQQPTTAVTEQPRPPQR